MLDINIYKLGLWKWGSKTIVSYTSKNRVVTTLHLNKFRPWNLPKKRCGYCDIIVSSSFHVASFVPWRYHNTFTSVTCLFFNFFTSQARIFISSSLYVKSGYSSISSRNITWEGLDLYFPSIDTWKMSWIFSSFKGKAYRYVIGLILSRISYGSINLGLRFPFLLKHITFF